MKNFNLAALIADAVEIGITTSLNQEQRDIYDLFLMQLRKVLSQESDALLALDKLIKRPSSRGAKILLEEELSALPETVTSDVLPSAERFVSITRTDASNREISTGGGQYFQNVSGSRNIVIGDVSSNFQSIGQISNTQLAAQDRKGLRNALISALPSQSDLRYLMYDRLNLDLHAIASSNTSFEETVYHLIQWAESNGRLRDLVEAAHQERPENSELNDFISLNFPDLN